MAVKDIHNFDSNTSITIFDGDKISILSIDSMNAVYRMFQLN